MPEYTHLSWEAAPGDTCDHLFTKGKKPVVFLGHQFMENCKANNSAFAKGMVLKNINDSQCKYGIEEECTVDLLKSPTDWCASPGKEGYQTPLTDYLGPAQFVCDDQADKTFLVPLGGQAACP